MHTTTTRAHGAWLAIAFAGLLALALHAPATARADVVTDPATPTVDSTATVTDPTTTTVDSVVPTPTVTVAFDSAGGSAVASQAVEVGGLVATPAPDPTRTGYTFAGWYADILGSQPWDFSADMVSADTTLHARWTIDSYAVTFASNGGSAVGSESVNYGELVVRPANPTRTGYTFAGWYANAALTSAWDFGGTPITGPTTLYAKWSINSYAVTFASNGGTAVSGQTLTYGALVTRPTDPTRTGYTFAGWYADPALTIAWDFANRTVADNTTLYAKWTINNYAVTFTSNGGTSVATQTVTYGGFATRPANPARTGYTFGGWYADAALTSAWDFSAMPITGPTRLYAKWAVISYTVTFASNNGSPIAEQTVDFGGLVTRPSDPTRTGYTFNGWYADAALTTPWDFSAERVGGDTTLYAKWTIDSFAVTFDSNGGTAVQSQTVTYGSLASTPSDPTRTGYTFAGWFADAALTTPWSFSAGTVSADVTLHAKWVVNGYAIAFASNGGSAVDGQVVEYGSLVTRPSDPTRAGYTFAGWYADEALTTPWDFSAMAVNGNATLYAGWTINSYRVTFHSSGGSAVASQTVEYGGLVTRPASPTRGGYWFAGWFADAALTRAWDFSASTIGAADQDLYAKWTKTYTITGFAGAGGTLSIRGTRVVGAGSTLTVSITPVSGYGVANVVVDGVSRGAIRSYTFANIGGNHTISASFKRTTSTTLSESVTSVKSGGYVTLSARLRSAVGGIPGAYLRFEVRLPGSSTWLLLKTLKTSSTGRASYRYQLLNKGTRYHRVRFLGNATYLPAPLANGIALKVY